MASVTVLTVGKLKEKFYLSACEEYLKRLKGYLPCTLIELPECRLPENPSPAEIRAGLAKEAEEIKKRIPKGAWFCVCTPEGKGLSSEELAETMKQVKLSGKSSLCFLIGSSFGMDPSVKAMADFRLSMSKMTFPHHLFRVMLLEQIYRAEAIQAGSKYHK
ncbi:MAG: 23S rRNA (pseudouridine(1915)-N(3))-methyltransferase RlmH [Oscillospiraceae bacterium]|nr:23S rRNA (pseudouridine(1915)-N(3))-methyltransferase RlmH [Oscillospiraceae bacterium]